MVVVGSVLPPALQPDESYPSVPLTVPCTDSKFIPSWFNRCSNWVVSNCSFCHKKIWLRGVSLKPEPTPKEHQRTTKPVWLAALAGSAQGSSISPRIQRVFKCLTCRALWFQTIRKRKGKTKHRESRNSCKSLWVLDCHWIFLCLHRPIWPICLNDEQYQLITCQEKILMIKGS